MYADTVRQSQHRVELVGYRVVEVVGSAVGSDVGSEVGSAVGSIVGVITAVLDVSGIGFEVVESALEQISSSVLCQYMY